MDTGALSTHCPTELLEELPEELRPEMLPSPEEKSATEQANDVEETSKLHRSFDAALSQMEEAFALKTSKRVQELESKLESQANELEEIRRRERKLKKKLVAAEPEKTEGGSSSDGSPKESAFSADLREELEKSKKESKDYLRAESYQVA